MSFKQLYIFVEGNDDERFFQEILKPKLKKKYGIIHCIKYAKKPKKFQYVEKFIKSIQSMGADYIFVTDINNAPCVTAKKQAIQNHISTIASDRILVVIKEIESWYLAGLDDHSAKQLGIRNLPCTTDTLTKEQFNSLIPRRFDSRIDFIRELLKHYSLEIAQQNNRSLKYCVEKYVY